MNESIYPLNIVIPTYNRKETLHRCLKSLEGQNFDRSLFIVTVVDDGSNDGTDFEVAWLKKSLNYDLQLINQKNSGAGAARNRGIFSVESKYILSIGDDILPQDPNFLQVHYDSLENSDGNTAFIGYTTWHPDLPESRFRHWLENGGPQFDFRNLRNGETTDFWHFYTSNLSIPTSLLKKESFDGLFTGYGWEDIELGYRLVKNHQCKIIYLADAKAWHLHEVEESDIWNRSAAFKDGAKIFETKHPEVNILPSGFKKLLIKYANISPVYKFASLIKKEWGWYLRFKKTTL